MGKLVAVGNLKGGTGKSTIAVNVACALHADGHDVVIVDADAQGSATDWHAGDRLPVGVESLPLGMERDAQKWVARVLSLKAAYDEVVVDLPPQVGSGIASALLIADLFVIPVTPSGVDLRATGRALDLLRRARAIRGADKPACMLVPSRVDGRTSIGRRIQTTLEHFGLSVGPAIRQRAAHADAFDAGAWIGGHAPGSPGDREFRLLKDQIEDVLSRADQRREPEAAPGFAATPLPGTIGAARASEVRPPQAEPALERTGT